VLLTLRASGLGDFLTAVPAFRALSKAFPGHAHVVAAPAELWPLAALCGGIDVLIPTYGLGAEPPLVGADIAVNLHGCGPESHCLLLRGSPARLIAFAHPEVDASRGGPAWDEAEHDVTRWCRLLEHYGIDADPGSLDLEPPLGPIPPTVRGATILHPGAGAPSRRWPAERWIGVGRAERAAGRPVAVTAGPGEVDLACRIASDAGVRAAVVECSRDLAQLVRVIAAAARIVCGDTGVAHLATALRTPSVVLFGPTPPGQWGPPADRPWHVALWAGSIGDPHGRDPDPGLLEISVADVVRALRRLPVATTF
jgi:ADP-heptose:LPS heptosyltransferase